MMKMHIIAQVDYHRIERNSIKFTLLNNTIWGISGHPKRWYAYDIEHETLNKGNQNSLLFRVAIRPYELMRVGIISWYHEHHNSSLLCHVL